MMYHMTHEITIAGGYVGEIEVRAEIDVISGDPDVVEIDVEISEIDGQRNMIRSWIPLAGKSGDIGDTLRRDVLRALKGRRADILQRWAEWLVENRADIAADMGYTTAL